MTSIRLAHAGADYEVIVGRIDEALPKISALAAGVRLPIVSDRRVFGLYGGILAEIGLVNDYQHGSAAQ